MLTQPTKKDMLKLYISVKKEISMKYQKGKSNKISLYAKFISHSKKGASLLQYGLVVGLIAVIAIASVNSIGSNVNGLFTVVENKMSEVASPSGDTGSSSESGGSGTPLCSAITASDTIGILCEFGSDTMIFAGLTVAHDNGDSSPLTPFFAARCDHGQVYNETSSQCECDAGTITELGSSINTNGDDPTDNSCDGAITFDRSNFPWNDGTNTAYIDTILDDVDACSGGECTESASHDGADEPWNVAWDGQANSDYLINTVQDSTSGGGIDPFEAAEACDNLGSGWYLPSINEIDVMFDNKNAGEFAGSFDTGTTFPHNRYWSSSERVDAADAWYQNLNSGMQERDSKQTGLSVRCVRR